MQLSTYDKSRVRYHLGYFTTSVPAGDYARLEEAMNTIPDSLFYRKIIYHLGRCDTAERKTEVATAPSTRIEKIEGDVDRTIASSNAREALRTWDEIYLYETNALAQILYVPTTKILSSLVTGMNVLAQSLFRHYWSSRCCCWI